MITRSRRYYSTSRDAFATNSYQEAHKAWETGITNIPMESRSNMGEGFKKYASDGELRRAMHLGCRRKLVYDFAC